MIALLQTVQRASVQVDGEQIAAIDQGLLAYLGFARDDQYEDLADFIARIIAYRIFADPEAKMNLSLADTGASLLLVPQFTLVANTRKGLRPNFSQALAPAEAERWFNKAVELARNESRLLRVGAGKFGARMLVSSVNDGPTNFILQYSHRSG